MEFSQAIRAVKERLSLVDIARRYVNLHPAGNRFTGPCPFHQETKPSFSISPDKGVFYCFGCQASGDIFEFYGRINGLDFKESVAQLAQEAGIEVEYGRGSVRSGYDRAEAKKHRTLKQAMISMHEDAARYYGQNFNKSHEARQYAAKRGLSEDIIGRFGIGWAERDWHGLENHLLRQGHDLAICAQAGLVARSEKGHYYDRFRGRLMFPIKNLSNQTLAFGGRDITGEEDAKYINSSESPIYSKREHLYGLAQARRGITASGHALLTEGYMDVLTLHQYGFENGVGVLGTAFTEEQIQRLSGFTSSIRLIFDGDRAGRHAALRGCELLLTRGLACSVILLPDGEDIDSFLREQGADAFAALMDAAQDGIVFLANTLRGLAPRDAIAKAREFLARMRVSELVSPYATILAQRLGVSEREFRNGLAARDSCGGSRAISDRDLCERDTQIILYATRYPERLEDLRMLGADLALSTERARIFWSLIEQYGPEEVVYHLDERQKLFWQRQRGPEAPPRDNGDYELSCLKRSLDQFYARARAATLKPAAGCDNIDLNLQYLHAIRDAMRNSNEQS